MYYLVTLEYKRVHDFIMDLGTKVPASGDLIKEEARTPLASWGSRGIEPQ